jgi:hypothetical protein
MSSMIERRKSDASEPGGFAPSGGELLRRDAKGRVRTPGPRREALLAQFDRSGLSGAEFAKLTGIKYPTFAGWLHQRRRKASQRPKVQWLEAGVPVAAPEAVARRLRVDLPGGAWMELHAEELAGAAALLRELGRVPVEGGAPC